MDSSNVNSKGVMPCSGLEMKVGSGRSGEPPSHFTAYVGACPGRVRVGLQMLWASLLEQKQLLVWLGMKCKTGFAFPVLLPLFLSSFGFPSNFKGAVQSIRSRCNEMV